MEPTGQPPFAPGIPAVTPMAVHAMAAAPARARGAAPCFVYYKAAPCPGITLGRTSAE